MSQDAFYEQLNEAKACVEEPPQPKIILRAPSAQTPQAQSGRPKRITIHVGGGREGSQGSPAPQASHPVPAQGPGEGAVDGTTTRPTPVNPAAANLAQVAGPGTPSAVMKREDSNRASPTVAPPLNNGYSSSAFRPVMLPPAGGLGQSAPQPGPPNGHMPGHQQQAAALYDFTFRCAGVGKSGAHDMIRTPFLTSSQVCRRQFWPTCVCVRQQTMARRSNLFSTYPLIRNCCSNLLRSISRPASGNSRSYHGSRQPSSSSSAPISCTWLSTDRPWLAGFQTPGTRSRTENSCTMHSSTKASTPLCCR